ncbi:hypothetical protein [Bradyrhizobium sp. Ai1a-2]|uniref:hypothetical protein n=1 Tax=Bradyrhizobium sp. Ai1a-2 TaxID=196490 RepID=UPI000414DCC2|nr:hypothetical protein [Bradyrhizobium sp. Ai1a-2]
MNIQARRLAIALAIAVPLAVAATAESSAAPIHGMSIKAAAPAATTNVRYLVRPYTYPSYWGYPNYNSYWGYPTYNSYWSYPTYYYSYPGYAYGW